MSLSSQLTIARRLMCSASGTASQSAVAVRRTATLHRRRAWQRPRNNFCARGSCSSTSTKCSHDPSLRHVVAAGCLTIAVTACIEQQSGSDRHDAKCQLESPPTSSSNNNQTTKATFDINDVYDLSGELLGEGAYGRVYRAHRRSDGIPVALKEIITEDTDQKEFDREIAALAYLSKNGGHKNVCRLFGVHRAGSVNYVALEIIEGGEVLEHLILSGPYSEGTAAKFVRELAEAVDYMHNLGYVHADLKCENLLLSSWEEENARLVVVDFGCAVKANCQTLGTENGDFSGTAAYCPPERLRDEIGLPTMPSDMWAIGIIIYILLTGSHPFDPRGDLDDESMEKLIASITPDDKGLSLIKSLAFADDRVSSLTESSKALIKNLMHVDPDKRMTAKQFVAHPWVQGLEASWKTMEGSDEKLKSFWQHNFRAAILRKYGKEKEGEPKKTLSDANLRHIFDVIDLDANGTLDANELRCALRQLGVAEENIGIMIASCDLDKSGSVSFSEFQQIMRQSFNDGPGTKISNKKRFQAAVLSALSSLDGHDDSGAVNDKRMRHLFAIIDADGNGTLSHEELQKFLSRFAFSSTTISEIIDEVDLDGSGSIDIDEFLAVMKKVANVDISYKTKKTQMLFSS